MAAAMDVDAAGVGAGAGDDERIVIPSEYGERVFSPRIDTAMAVRKTLEVMRAPLSAWQRAAFKFRSVGETAKCEELLRAGVELALLAPRSDPVATSEAVRIVTALAGHFMDAAFLERSSDRHQSLMTEAGQAIANARKINAHDPMLWVATGLYFLLSDNESTPAQIGTHFGNALSRDRSFVPGLLGQAVLAMSSGKHEDALLKFSEALALCPTVGSAVRVAMGVCYDALEDRAMARACFQRALDVNPRDLEARIAIGVFDLNDGRIEAGVRQLNAVLAESPADAHALLGVAQHCFYRNDFAHARLLASRAYDRATCDEHLSDAAALMARMLHAEGAYTEASALYSHSVRHARTSHVAQYGLAQAFHANPKGENLSHLLGLYRGLLKAAPASFEVARGLADVEVSTGRPEAEKHLTMALRAREGDRTTMLMLAEEVQAREPERAAALYSELIHAAEAAGERVAPAMHCNHGVVLCELRRFEEAEAALARAYLTADGESVRVPDDDDAAGDGGMRPARTFAEIPEELRYLPLNATVAFNIGRLKESQGQAEAATAVYDALVEAVRGLAPSTGGSLLLIDCHIRRGLIQRALGHKARAEGCFKEAIGVNELNADAWSQIGTLSLEHREYDAAMRAFSKIRKDVHKEDDYAALALGNVNYLCAVPQEKHFVDFLRASEKFFEHVLEKEPRNVYAANGLGTVLAELSGLETAQPIFEAVREAAVDLPDVWINLGHCYLGRRMFAQAVHMYEKALARFYNNRAPDVMALVARAYFDWRRFDDARRWLQRALHIDPRSTNIRFNLALASQAAAAQILDVPPRERAVDDVERAIRMLTFSGREFKYLMKAKVKRSRELSDEAVFLYSQAGAILAQTQAFAAERRARKEQQVAEDAAARAAVAADAAAAAAVAKRSAEEAARVVAEDRARMAALMAKASVPVPKAKRAGKKPRKQAKDADEEEMAEAIALQDQRRGGGRRRGGAAGAAADDGGDDDDDASDEDYNPLRDAARHEREDAEGEARMDAEGADEVSDEGVARRIRIKPPKRGRRIADDDDDDDEAAAVEGSEGSEGEREATPMQVDELEDLFGDIEEGLVEAAAVAPGAAVVAAVAAAAGGVGKRGRDGDDEGSEERAAKRARGLDGDAVEPAAEAADAPAAEPEPEGSPIIDVVG